MYKHILSNNPQLKTLPVLLVDDSEISLKILQRDLLEAGLDNLHFASSGLDALNKLEDVNPSIIVSDLYMPEIDGFELCKKLKSNKETAEIPVLIQTSATDVGEISKAFESGANDVVIKPIQKAEFLSRLVLHLENSLFRRRVKQELEAEVELQNSIMPEVEDIENTSKIHSVEIKSLFKPCSEVGGDFWGFKEISRSELSIFNVDISGHGVASAMNALRIHTLMQGKLGVLPSSELFMRKLNRKICDLIPLGQYATIFYGIINFEENYIEYSNAGAPKPIIIRNNGSVDIIEGTYLPVGIEKNFAYESKKIGFGKGDYVLLFSDALIETPNDQGEFLTHQKLAKILSKYSGKSADDMLKFVIEKFENFIGKNAINDDLTINVYKRS